MQTPDVTSACSIYGTCRWSCPAAHRWARVLAIPPRRWSGAQPYLERLFPLDSSRASGSDCYQVGTAPRCAGTTGSSSLHAGLGRPIQLPSDMLCHGSHHIFAAGMAQVPRHYRLSVVEPAHGALRQALLVCLGDPVRSVALLTHKVTQVLCLCEGPGMRCLGLAGAAESRACLDVCASRRAESWESRAVDAPRLQRCPDPRGHRPVCLTCAVLSCWRCGVQTVVACCASRG